uniref:Uncharacterized protein n=1 Tax=Opuntia streptacantha TaxID=393608 RepID=A0A7C9ERJ4_OPUST
MNNIHLRSILCQKCRLLHCRITSPNHRQGFVPKNRSRTIANSACRYPAVPEPAGTFTSAGKIKPFGNGSGGNDHSVSQNGGLGILREDLKRRRRQVDGGDRFGQDLRTETHRLLTKLVGDLKA